MSSICRFLLIFASLVHLSVASFHGLNHESVSNTTKFRQNIKIVLDELPTNKTSIYLYRWVGVQSGVVPNAAYAQARCIGFVDNYTCDNCIQEATDSLKKDLSSEATSVTIYSGVDCIAQFSDHDLIGNMNSISTTKNSSKVESSSEVPFNNARNGLFFKLVENTKARQDGYQMSAAGKWYEGTSKKTVYGAAQCSSNLNSSQCNSCFDKVNEQLSKEDFDGLLGGSIVGPSCNFQYEVYPFLSNNLLFVDLLPPSQPSLQVLTPSSQPSPQVLTPPSTGERSTKVVLPIYVVAPIVIFSIIL